VGVAHPFSDVAVVDLAFFYHDIEDWITRDFPFIDEAYHNFSNVVVRGIELATEVYPCERLTLRFGYTFQDAEDKSSGRVTDRVVHVPQHKFDVGATYEVPQTQTRIDLTTTYVDESYSQLPTPFDPDADVLKGDDYYLVNARITQPFMEHFEAYVAINNLLDQDYQPEYGFPAAGLNWWVGLTARF
jgi:iron complex outermembrane receptor protein